jgi:HAD superfamily hydrolase (TIGR01509 family)
MPLSETGLARLSPEPIRRAARRLRWFKTSFQKQVDAISAESGVHFEVDSGRLVQVFLTWLREFEAQKPHSPRARHAFVGFASGLMLRQMIKTQPLRVLSVPTDADPANPAYFWPEGYVYAAYCLNVRRAILEQDFDEARQVSPDFDDLRVWWSFKENVSENASYAISFLDLFAGETPNWDFPSVFFSETSAPLRLRRARSKPLAAPETRKSPGLQIAPTLTSPRATVEGGAMADNVAHLGGATMPTLHQLPRECRLVIIGLEGALADTSAMMLDELCQLINESGVPITLEETRRKFLGTSVLVPMTFVAQKTGRICPGHFRENLEQRIGKRLAAGVALLPGGSAFLADLERREIAMTFVSCGSDAMADQVLDGVGLKRGFAGEVHDAGKPLADLVVQAATDAGLHPQVCVVIHDAPHAIAAAAQAGMFAIGQVGGTHLRAIRDAQRAALMQSGARFVLDGYAEITAS